MKLRTVTKQQAARFLLLRHGLIDHYRYCGKNGVLAFIRSVGCIQYDPIDVCGRNAELVLQARVKGFRKEMLQELLYEDRSLIDYWDKCMAIFPVEDWPYFARTRMQNTYNAEAVRPALALARETVASQGPCCSDDIPDGREKVRWPWGYAPIGRAALETLYFQGELVIHNKQGTRKYYDFAARHLPPELLSAPDPNQTQAEYYRWAVARRIGSVGLLWNRPSDAWLEIRGLDMKARTAAIEDLCALGTIVAIWVEDIRQPLYFHKQDLPLLETACGTEKLAPRCEFIAPLDNLLWDRKLIEAVFGFSYRWEIYTPPAKRQYGYYTLPVLYGEGFAGRIELVCDRKENRLILKNLWLEPGKRLPRSALQRALTRFARFHQCSAPEIES